MEAKRSIIDYLAENARRTPDRVAVHFRDAKVTPRERGRPARPATGQTAAGKRTARMCGRGERPAAGAGSGPGEKAGGAGVRGCARLPGTDPRRAPCGGRGGEGRACGDRAFIGAV